MSILRMVDKWLAISFFVVGLSNVAKPFCTVLDMNASKQAEERFSFEQPLDHFNVFNTEKLEQMFWEKCNLYEEGGPVFLSIGGYSPVTEPWPQESALEEYAREHKALIFKVEHRFYGESNPVLEGGNINLDMSNLKYLSTSQALADLANFIQTMNKVHPLLKSHSPPPRWVAFGCFYAGTLATWLRAKYPHLVYAAVASSAPLLARHDSPVYIDDIADIIEDRRNDCGTEFKLAMYSLKQNSVFEPCNSKPKSDMKVNQETSILLDLALRTARLAQTDADIKTFCDIILDKTVENPVMRFIDGLTELGLNMTVECEHTYDKCQEAYMITNESPIPDELCPLYRQFKYQQCTEFGHFQALEKTGQCMPTFSTQQCTSIFGKEFSERFITDAIKRYNIEYGGLDMEASRVVSIYGSLDPWRTLGLTSPKNEESPVLIITGGIHCVDQRLASLKIPQERNIAAVQEDVSNILGLWLNGGSVISRAEHSEGQSTQEELTIPWWAYLLVGLLVGCVLAVIFVLLKFKKTSETLHH